MHKLLLIIPILVLASVGLFLLNRPKPVKTETKSAPKTVDSLFVYNPKNSLGINNLKSYDKNEPAFSIKLPDGWYLDLNVSGNERLISFSPTKAIKDAPYRVYFTVKITPTKLNLAEEVARAKNDIGKYAQDNKFIIDKAVKLKNYPAHFLEYNASEPLIHNVDVIAVKNGFFVDIAAFVDEWAWGKVVDAVEKTINSFTFID